MKYTKASTRTLEQRFWDNVDKGDGSGCWIWKGSILKNGYGRITHDSKTYKAHRVAWIIEHGSVPSDLCVCHSCDNPPCVRVDHLWLGTHTQNIADRHTKKRTANGKKIRNTVKLTEDDIRNMRALWDKEGVELKPGQRGGLNYCALGRIFGVSGSMARSIIKGVFWKHVS